MHDLMVTEILVPPGRPWIRGREARTVPVGRLRVASAHDFTP